MAVRPGYKMTEVGIIPGNWTVESLGELADFVTSGSRGWAQFYSNYGALFIRSQNIRDDQLCFDDIQYVSPPSGAEGNRTKVELNDLLITITGNSVGNVALVNQVFDDAYISQHVGLVRLKEPTQAEYICRYLTPNSPGNSQIAASQSGQSKPGLNLQNLKEFLIALPPSSEEQHAITSALSEIDALIVALEQLITKKRYLKQAVMQQLLTGRTRLPGFNGEWTERTLVEIATISKGVQLPSSEIDPNGHFPHYNGGVQPSSYTVRFNTPANTIAISEGGNSCGFVQFITERFWCGGHCYAVVPKTIDNRFMFSALKGQQSAVMGLRVGSGLPNIQKTALGLFKLKFPKDPIEQTAIADYLAALDSELFALEARRDKTREIKHAMMKDLLTGKTRLVQVELNG